MMTIIYRQSLDGLQPEQLHDGFFDGWLRYPDHATHWRILQDSYRIWLAIDDETHIIVGFINAISDGVLCAFIPLLEVIPAYQGQGIGTALVEHMQASLAHLYSIDLICDADLQPFYARLGMQPYTGMIQRNYDNQAGVSNTKPE
jgi:GNAT superfamily N-acetyltransferase